MSNQTNDPLDRDEPEPPYPVNQKFAFASSTAVVMGLTDWMMHFGPTGLVVGGLASYVAWKHGPELYEQVRGMFPRPAAAPAEQTSVAHIAKHPAKRGWFERAFAIPAEESPTDADEPEASNEEEDADEDTVVIPESDGEQYDASLVVLNLGKGLHLHPNVIFSHNTAILGQPGVGKSNLVAVLSEELGQYDAPLILFDKKPEYERLCQRPYLTHPSKADASNITPRNAQEIAAQIIDRRLHVVLDLSSYSPAHAALVMVGLLAGISKYQATLPFEDRRPCTLILEEAHYWLPQDQALSVLRGIKYGSEPLQSLLTRAWMHTASLSRDLGVGVISATQRPAGVDKRLIAYAQNRFLMHAVEARDLEVYREYGCSAAQAQRLVTGDAFVLTEKGPLGIFHIRRRNSPDLSRSPGLENIRNAGLVSDSPIHYSPEVGRVERLPTVMNGEQVNGELPVNPPEKRVNGGERYGESSPEPVNVVNPVNDTEEQSGYSPAEEMQVILAYAKLVESAQPGDGSITRTAIMKYLGWNTKHYQRIIKPVCDKHSIAL